MTREQKLQLGLNAARILEDENIMFFLSDELERIKTASFNTLPDEGKRRSELYYQHYALNEFVNSLVAYRSAAEEILKEEDN